MPYATQQDLFDRYDRRVLSQLSNDGNSGDENPAAIAAALEDASSEINSAAMQGSVYTTDDLDNLSGTARSILIWLTCTLAAMGIASRRVQGLPPDVRQSRERAEKTLEAMRQGGRVFDVARNRNADTPSVRNDSPSDFPRSNRFTATSFFGHMGDGA